MNFSSEVKVIKRGQMEMVEIWIVNIIEECLWQTCQIYHWLQRCMRKFWGGRVIEVSLSRWLHVCAFIKTEIYTKKSEFYWIFKKCVCIFKFWLFIISAATILVQVTYHLCLEYINNWTLMVLLTKNEMPVLNWESTRYKVPLKFESIVRHKSQDV